MSQANETKQEREQREKDENDPERQIYVGGLPWSANETSLKEEFGKVGEVTHVRVRA